MTPNVLTSVMTPSYDGHVSTARTTEGATIMTATHTEVYFTVNARTGKRRAWRMSYRQFRAFPMPLAEAELAVATGTATDIGRNPFRPA